MSFLSRKVLRSANSPSAAARVLIVVGALLLAAAIFYDSQVTAFIGLGLTLWGAIFAVARSGKYVKSSLLDGSAKSAYSTIDRMITDLKYVGQGYYIPAYPQDVALPDYLDSLREPVVFISETFDGKLSVDELAERKFLSSRTNGVFIAAPGSEIMSQMERQMQIDFSKLKLQEVSELLPNSLTEIFNLAKTAEISLIPNGATFKATGIIYESLYKADGKLKSVRMLGCPVVSAVASTLAKSSGKTVIIRELVQLPTVFGVNVTFNFM